MLIQFHKFVFLASQPELFGVFQIVHPVFGVDTFDKVRLAVVGRIAHGVDAGAVESHGVEGGEDAEVAHLRIGRSGHTVAIHRKVVCHADVQHPVADVVDDGF